MKANRVLRESLLVTLLASPFVFLFIVWNELPSTFPTHFSISGEPDRFGNKTEVLTVMGVITAFLYTILTVIPYIDPKKRLTAANYDRVRRSFSLLWSGFLVIMFWAIWRGISTEIVPTLTTSFVCLLFAALGNVMVSLPSNYFVGIRTPWTLDNQDNWRKTHRLAGRIWVIGGVVGFIGGLFLPEPYKVIWVLVITAIISLVPMGYSYWLYRKQLVLLVGLLLLAGMAQAQTDEPIHYAITAPAGVSLTLDGTLTLPAQAKTPMPAVLIIAGSGATDRDGNSPAPIGGFGTLKAGTYRQLADSLVKAGIAVARYDKRGSGTNIPAAIKVIKPQEHRFDYYVSDAVGFIKQLQADKRFSKVIVAGHSEGSLVGMLAAIDTKADGYISIAGAGRNIADVLKVQLQGLPDEQRQLAYRDLDSLRNGQTVQKPAQAAIMVLHPIVQPGMISWMKYDPAVEIKKFKGPVLIINGKRDTQVAASEAELLKAARPDAQLVLFDEMNHVLKNAQESQLENIKTYADPSLPLTPGVAPAIISFVKRL
ncbi:hypothetical protein GCM10028806_03790 [Spirosoma terrae]|uniref:DUF1648 domain-containing protein n=1 Tax=Spirosoma terrae TaxID=1968276 RepID=A0A6L9LBY0_9BACT|nr:alpha/beta fold hydrolase [Spirosoma terrae]NDU98065.1 DUF1648 domain-containing protein [Spirosoma terrae]